MAKLNSVVIVALLAAVVLTTTIALNNGFTGEAVRTNNYYCCGGDTVDTISISTYCVSGQNRYTWSQWSGASVADACVLTSCDSWCRDHGYSYYTLQEGGTVCACSTVNSA